LLTSLHSDISVKSKRICPKKKLSFIDEIRNQKSLGLKSNLLLNNFPLAFEFLKVEFSMLSTVKHFYSLWKWESQNGYFKEKRHKYNNIKWKPISFYNKFFNEYKTSYWNVKQYMFVVFKPLLNAMQIKRQKSIIHV